MFLIPALPPCENAASNPSGHCTKQACIIYRREVFVYDDNRKIYGLIFLHRINQTILLQLYVSPHIYAYHVLLQRNLERSHFTQQHHCFNDLKELVYISVKSAIINRRVQVSHEDKTRRNGTVATLFKTFYVAIHAHATGSYIEPGTGRKLFQFGVTVLFKGR